MVLRTRGYAVIPCSEDHGISSLVRSLGAKLRAVVIIHRNNLDEAEQVAGHIQAIETDRAPVLYVDQLSKAGPVPPCER